MDNKNLNSVINYFYEVQAVTMQDLNKDVYDYIYYNYDSIKYYIVINRIGINYIYSLSNKGREYIRQKQE